MRFLLTLIALIMITGLATAQTTTTVTLNPVYWEKINNTYSLKKEITYTKPICSAYDILLGGAEDFARCLTYYTGITYTQDFVDNATMGIDAKGEFFKKVEFDPNLRISDFMGECNHSDTSVYNMLQCSSNFINPSLNFNLLFMPFYILKNDILTLQLSGILDFIVNFFKAIIRFALHFAFKFALTYLLWISLGFQVLIGFIDRNKTLEHEEKITYTFILMAGATLYTMINGLGVLI